MNVCLFHSRTLKIAPGTDIVDTGLLTIYTVYHPESDIYFDALFLTRETHDDKKSTETYCVHIETDPKILDGEVDEALCKRFETLIEEKNFLTATLTEAIKQDVMQNAVDSSMQLITH